MLVSILKGIITLWPFLKELVLGNQDLRNHVRRNKGSTFLLAALFIMFLLFLFIADAALTTGKALQQAEHEKSLLSVKYEGAIKDIEEIRESKDDYSRRLDLAGVEITELKNQVKLLQQEVISHGDPQPVEPRRGTTVSAPKTVQRAKPIVRSTLADRLNELRMSEGEQ